MRLSKIFRLTIAVVLLSSTAFAEGDKTLFLEKCASCHRKGGEAEPVNPADKAAIVWEKYFQRGRHRIELSPTVNESELKVLIAYLQAYAADSDRPATAVIPK